MSFFKKSCCKYKFIRKIIVGIVFFTIICSSFYAWHIAGVTRTRAVQTEAATTSTLVKERVRTVRNAALKKEQQDQVKRDLQLPQQQPSVEKKSITVPAISTNKYTQTQAFLSLPAMKALVEKTYNIKPYTQLIDSIIAKEVEFKDNYYVFYHGTDNVWRLPQDLYTQLYAYFHPLELNPSKDFKFLRFDDVYASAPKDFLTNELKKGGLINDHGAMGAILLAVNLALFANVGDPTECTWEYFVKSRGHLNPDRAIYEKIMDKFGLTHKYINELMSLVKMYETKEETILQIFVPQNKVDEIGYLAWVRGIPADEETIKWIEDHVEDKTFSKRRYAIDELTDVFKKEQAKNPIFRNLMNRVEKGDFSLNAFLKIYCNQPQTIKNINNISARLLFTPNVLLNPNSGVKTFRYSKATPEQLERYHTRLTEIVNKILAEKTP